jgi:galactose-1-phosphate uridylyltransferase
VSGMLRSPQRIEDGAGVVALEPAVCGDRSFTFAVGARIHQRDSVASAKKDERVFENAHAVIRNAVEEQHPATIGLPGADFPAVQKNRVGRANVKGFAVDTNLREGSVRLLNEVGCKWAANGMEKRRSYKPSERHSHDRWNEKQDEQDADDVPAHGLHFKNTKN